jgi:hypothetical protein
MFLSLSFLQNKAENKISCKTLFFLTPNAFVNPFWHFLSTSDSIIETKKQKSHPKRGWPILQGILGFPFNLRRLRNEKEEKRQGTDPVMDL